MAVQDEGWWHFTDEGKQALKSVGANNPSVVYRGSYALIGYKGKVNPSWVRERISGKGRGPTILEATIPYRRVPAPPASPTAPLAGTS